MPGLMPVAEISWGDILENGAELIKEYAEECADPRLGEINPAWSSYCALEQAGMLQCLGVYVGERLVGFATVLTSTVPHYGTQMAVVESLFVSFAYRSAGLGTELIRAVEAYARDSGSVGVLYSVRPGSRLEQLFEAKHYLRHAVVFYRPT